MLTIIGQDIISGNMGYIGTEPGRLYRMGPQSKVAEASGEPPVVLADCKKKPLKGLKVYGRSKQVTTTGAQLLDISSGKNVFITGETQGEVIQEIQNSSYPNSVTYDEIPVAIGTYYIKIAETNSDGYRIRFYNDDNIASRPTSIPTSNTVIKITEGTTKIRLMCLNGPASEDTMICAGSAPLPWEPYTGGKPSPSPDYPQEIESAGMRWSTGAQLWKYGDVEIYQRRTYDIHLSAGDYIITADILSDDFVDSDVCYITVPNQPGFRLLPGIEKSVVLSLKNDTETITLYAGNGYTASEGKTMTLKNIMFNMGSSAAPYEPYTGGVPKPYGDKIGVNVHGKNLIPFPYPLLGGVGTKTELNGVTYTVQEDGGVRCIGTPNSVFGVSLSMIRFSDKPLSVGGPTDGKVVLSGGPLYFDSNNKKLFFFFDTKQVGNPIDTVIYPQIEIGTVATPYEPYHEPQFASIATPNGLPGIPVSSGGNYTDADGQQWICDEIDLARGVYVQNIKVSKNLNKLGWLTWGVNKGANGITGFFTYDIDVPKIDNAISNIAIYNGDIYGGKRAGICASIIKSTSSIPYMMLSVRNDTISDTSSNNAAIQSFKKMLAETDAYMMYVLVTPVETPLTADQLAAYKALRTYKGTTIIDNDAGAYMSVKYNT